MNTFPNIPIVYEDDDLLLINKPAGIVVNRAQTVGELTVQDWMERRGADTGYQRSERTDSEPVSGEYGTPEEIFLQRSGIAHRLDKETSGILVIAKHPQALQHLLAQFKTRQTQKTYLALVHGKFSTQEGMIDLPIGRNIKFRLQFAVREMGRPSQTEYQVLQFFPHLDIQKVLAQRTEESREQFQQAFAKNQSANFKKATKSYQGFSLVRVFPKTGRTHQIRVHMSHIKHPLVGDKLYNGKKRVVLDQVWCPRHFLHAESITLTHPATQQSVTFTAPLPEDLAHVLQCVTE